MPNKREAKKPASVFSREDLTVIFEKFNKEHDFYIPLMIMYHTGCRIGEALALHWRDIDMDTNTIYIHATMLESGEISPIPKSKSSNRFIAFSSKLHSILDERLQEQKELSVMMDTEFLYITLSYVTDNYTLTKEIYYINTYIYIYCHCIIIKM